MYLRSHVVDVKRCYRSFNRYMLSDERPDGGIFSIEELDVMSEPLVRYIADYGYTPPPPMYYGDIPSHYQIDIPDDYIRYFVEHTKLNPHDIMYLLHLLSGACGYVAEDMLESIIEINPTISAKVFIKRLGDGNWMFYVTEK